MRPALAQLAENVNVAPKDRSACRTNCHSVSEMSKGSSVADGLRTN
jgi:hypothetical protein